MRRYILPASLAIAFALTALPAAAASPSAHDHHGQPRLALDEGRKWATDEPLRREMSALRDALVEVKKSRVRAADYRALGNLVEYRVGRIVAECKLTPAADANLHVVVAELVGAADALRDADAANDPDAVRRATLALNEYGKYFDHPGWKALR